MNSTYRRIPDPPVAHPGQSREAYGLDILAFVVRERTTAGLSDDQKALAIHVGPLAVAGPEMSATARETVQDARRWLQASAMRSLQHAAPSALPREESQTPPSGGQRVERVRPVPTRPPARDAVVAPVTIEF